MKLIDCFRASDRVVLIGENAPGTPNHWYPVEDWFEFDRDLWPHDEVPPAFDAFFDTEDTEDRFFFRQAQDVVPENGRVEAVLFDLLEEIPERKVRVRTLRFSKDVALAPEPAGDGQRG